MSNYKLDFSEISNELSFFDSYGADRFFCKCGGFLKIDHDEEEAVENIKVANKENEISIPGYDDDFNEVLKGFKIHGETSKRCPSCNLNFSLEDTRNKLVKTEEYFVSGFKLEEDEEKLKIYHSKVKALPVPLNTHKVNEKDMQIFFVEDLICISLNKQTKELTIKKGSKKEVPFDLDEVISNVDYFFTLETQVVLNLIDLHYYINKLSRYVSDSKNIDIITELISKLRGRYNSAGEDIFKIVLSIFYGIIKYSNLSTIALTKDSQFLYDLMKECRIPKPDEFIKQEATSPLEIFNFLTKNYIKILNEEINADNKEVHNFVYKGKKLKDLGENFENIDRLSTEGEDKELSISISENKNYIEGKIVKTENGIKVIDSTSDRRISKQLFKTIRNFSDYQKLVKFLKFINYENLMDLIQKYEIDLLINIVDLVYFRDEMNYEELKRLMPIFIDYAKIKTYQYNPTLQENLDINYTHLKNFSFVEYDDTLLMIKSLKFDPKKEFYKIKTYNHLQVFHNSVIQYYNAMSDAEKNGEFRSFVSKFRYLEEKNLYNGPLTVRLLSSPVLVIKEGNEMKHSGGSYVRRIMNGQYLLCQVIDNTIGLPKEENTRYTLGLFYDEKTGLEFDQVKGPCNIQGSDRFKKEMMNYLETLEISYRPLRDLKLIGE